MLRAIEEHEVGGAAGFDEPAVEAADAGRVAGREAEDEFRGDPAEAGQQRDHPEHPEGLDARAGGAVGAEDHAVRALQLQRRLRRRDRDALVAVVDDLDGARRLLAEFADVRLGQRRMAAVDVADHVGVGLEHDVLVDQAGPRDRRPARVDRAADAVLPGPRDHLLRLVAGLHRAEAHLAEQRDAGRGEVREVLLDHAFLDDWRTGQDLHPAGAEVVERALRRDRERLESDDVLRASGQVHFAGGDHRRHAAVQRRLDPAELVLARGPVAEDGMHVAVDQARRDAGAARVDQRRRLCRVEVGFATDGGDAAVVDHDRVGVEDRPVYVAGQQESDAADDHLAGRAGRDCLSHDVLLPCGNSGVPMVADYPGPGRDRAGDADRGHRVRSSGPSSGPPRNPSPCQ